MDNSNRIVIVTGAGGSVGSRVVRRWLDAGARVLGVGSRVGPLEELGHHKRLAIAAEDLTTQAGAQRMVECARASFGVPDTLIHTVGGFTMGATDAEDAGDGWDRMMAMNATSAFHCFRAMIPALREKGGGWMVGVGSRAGVEPVAQMAAYSASKAAFIALVKSLALELRSENIHVNAILPSTIDTPPNREAMGDKNVEKWVTTDDIADATLFLCSEAGRSVYGATLELYGKS